MDLLTCGNTGEGVFAISGLCGNWQQIGNSRNGVGSGVGLVALRADACPSIFWTTFTSAPLAMARLAAVLAQLVRVWGGNAAEDQVIRLLAGHMGGECGTRKIGRGSYDVAMIWLGIAATVSDGRTMRITFYAPGSTFVPVIAWGWEECG